MSSAAPLIIIMLLVGGIALWGFLTDWTFSGLLPREGARCTPDEDSKDENAKEYVYDEDKECLVVNKCKEGWEPNYSNTACVSELSGDTCTGANDKGVYKYNTSGVCVLDSLSYDVGTPIMCNANDVGSGVNVAVYRYMGGVDLRHYPDPTTAQSWDDNWVDGHKKIDCKGLKRGAPMPYNGEVDEYVRCTSNGFDSRDDDDVYIIKENNVLSPTTDHADQQITDINCVGYRLGS